MKLDINKINIFKAEKAITNADIAKKGGVTRPWISTILKKGEASPVTVNKLAKGLGVDVREIIKMED